MFITLCKKTLPIAKNCIRQYSNNVQTSFYNKHGNKIIIGFCGGVIGGGIMHTMYNNYKNDQRKQDTMAERQTRTYYDLTGKEFNDSFPEKTFVKLTNEAETEVRPSDTSLFQTGLNVVTTPRKYYTDGINFTEYNDTKIYNQLDDTKQWIRVATIPDDAIMMNHGSFFNTNKIILSERQHIWTNYDACKIIVASDGKYLANVDPTIITDELCMLAVKSHGYGISLNDVPDKMRTSEVCKASVEKYSPNLEFVPAKLRTLELCTIAVADKGSNLKYVPDHMKTSELCEMAVIKDGSNLDHVPDNIRTTGLCALAVIHTTKNISVSVRNDHNCYP
jgi:hypothetical protein